MSKYIRYARILRVFVLVGLVASLFWVSVAPVSATDRLLFDGPQRAKLQEYADRLRDAGTTGVLMESRFDWQTKSVRSGGVRLGTEQPVPWNAHFKAGSTTKTFIATVVLQLEAEGKLSLDDTLAQHLPGIGQGSAYDPTKITIRHLLAHTSGIYDYTNDEAFLNTILTAEGFEANRLKNYTPDNLLDLAFSHPPLFEPGTSWIYSNTNYVLAGLVIKAVTAQDWRTEVQNRILSPLHLTETSSAGSSAGLPFPFAHGYHIYTSELANRTYTDTTLHNMSWADAAADLITTTRDENRFFQALMRGQLLPPEQLTKMKTVTMLGEGVGYGLGIVWTSLPCDSRGSWSHGGSVIGYATGNGVTDDGKRSAVLSLSTTSFSDSAHLIEVGETSNAMISYALCGESDIINPSDTQEAFLKTNIQAPPDAAEQLYKRLRL